MAEFLNISQAQLKKWARLDDAKARQEEGIFLAEGVKVVEELLSSDWQIKALLIMPEKIKYWEKLSLPADRRYSRLSAYPFPVGKNRTGQRTGRNHGCSRHETGAGFFFMAG